MKRRKINLTNVEQYKCGISNCDNSIKRSLSRKKVDLVPELVTKDSSKRIGLCQSCYRIFKKSTKKERTLESLGR